MKDGTTGWAGRDGEKDQGGWIFEYRGAGREVGCGLCQTMLLYSWCFLDCINSPSTLTILLKKWYLPIRYFPPMITNLTRELRLLKIGVWDFGVLRFTHRLCKRKGTLTYLKRVPCRK